MTNELIFFFTRVESRIPQRRASKNRLIEWCLLLGNLYFSERTWLDFEPFKRLNILIVAVRKKDHSGSWGFSLLFLAHTKPERGCYCYGFLTQKNWRKCNTLKQILTMWINSLSATCTWLKILFAVIVATEKQRRTVLTNGLVWVTLAFLLSVVVSRTIISHCSTC